MSRWCSTGALALLLLMPAVLLTAATIDPDNLRTWWEVRNLPNVMLVHFAKLKEDMPGEIRRIAAFLDIAVDEAQWDNIVKHCSFDYMKDHAAACVPLGGAFWEGGAETFAYQSQIIGWNVNSGGTADVNVIYEEGKNLSKPTWLDLYR